jgi:hypothetical protein
MLTSKFFTIEQELKLINISIHCKYLGFMGIHLFHYIHGGERMASYDVVENAFMIIVRNARFHVSQE